MPKLSPSQLAERRRGIGSSDVAAILGLSPYRGRSAWGVYNEKRGLVEPEEPSPEQERGHDLEPVLAHWYKKETGAILAPGATLWHPTEPWAFCTRDYRIVEQRRNLELKAVGVGMLRGWDKYDDSGIPDHVRVQCAWQVWIADDEDSHVGAMLAGPSDFRIWHVPRDRELESMIVERCRAFWKRVQAEDPPVIDDSEECRAYLNAKYPRPVDPVIRPATEDEERIAKERWAAAQLVKGHTAAKERLDNELIARIEANTGILGAEGWKATRKTDKNGTTRYRFAAAKSWGGGEE